MKPVDRNELFERAPVPKALWSLALPTIASMMVTVLYNLVDTFFVAQTNHAVQVSAVSLAMPAFFILMAFGNLFGLGGSSAISRALGAKQYHKVKQISSFCLYASFVVGLAFMGIFISLLPQVSALMGAMGETAVYLEQYLFYICMGAPFAIFSTAFSNIVRSEGAAKVSLVGMFFGSMVNIVLDPIMIFYLDMGVVGAAVATVIGNICMTVFYLAYLLKGKTLLSLKLADASLQKDVVGNVLKIGVPGALNNILMGLANVVYNILLSDYGDEAIAAMGISMKVSTVIVMTMMGLAVGMQPLVGYAFGAKQYTKMREIIAYTMKTAALLGTALTICLMLLSPLILRSFMDNELVIAYGIKMLRLKSTVGLFLGTIFVSMNALQGMGIGIGSLILSVCRQGLVFIPVALFTKFIWGLNGLIWTQTIADFASLLIAVSMLLFFLKRLEHRAKLEDSV